MEYFLKKDEFYKKLKPFANLQTGIHFFLNFGDKKQYTLVFNWSDKTPAGKQNYIANVQLYDNRKTGRDKYITRDLFFNIRENNVTTDYKMYKFIRDWVQKSILKYENWR